jgi:hypothetical protein
MQPQQAAPPSHHPWVCPQSLRRMEGQPATGLRHQMLPDLLVVARHGVALGASEVPVIIRHNKPVCFVPSRQLHRASYFCDHYHSFISVHCFLRQRMWRMQVWCFPSQQHVCLSTPATDPPIVSMADFSRVLAVLADSSSQLCGRLGQLHASCLISCGLVSLWCASSPTLMSP